MSLLPALFLGIGNEIKFLNAIDQCNQADRVLELMTFRRSKRNQIRLANREIINAKGAEAAGYDSNRLRKARSRNCNYGIAYPGAVRIPDASADCAARRRRDVDIDRAIYVNRG